MAIVVGLTVVFTFVGALSSPDGPPRIDAVAVTDDAGFSGGDSGPGSGSTSDGQPGRFDPSVAHAVLERAAPSVATVYAYDYADRWGSRGTGFFIPAENSVRKLFVTNHHVIEYADVVLVVLTDGRRFRARRVLYADEGRDTAVLDLMAPDDALPPGLPLAERLPELLDDIYIVTAHDAETAVSDGFVWESADFGEGVFPRLRTTAHVVPGNSGSPVLNRDGEVVGIATARNDDGSPGVSVVVAFNESLRPVLRRQDAFAVGTWGPLSRRQRADHFVERAERFLEMGATGHALDQYLAAVQFDPGYVAVWFQIGLLRHRLGELDLALRAYERALRMADVSDEKLMEAAFYNIALIHAGQGNFDAAEQYALLAADVAPDSPGPWLLLSFVYHVGFEDGQRTATALEMLRALDEEQAALLWDYTGRR